MKLLFCLNCGDVRKLGHHWVRCDCGDSAGHYLPNGHDAEYAGSARILGLGNGSLEKALRYPGSEKPSEGNNVLCWIKPPECDRLAYLGPKAPLFRSEVRV